MHKAIWVDLFLAGTTALVIPGVIEVGVLLHALAVCRVVGAVFPGPSAGVLVAARPADPRGLVALHLAGLVLVVHLAQAVEELPGVRRVVVLQGHGKGRDLANDSACSVVLFCQLLVLFLDLGGVTQQAHLCGSAGAEVGLVAIGSKVLVGVTVDPLLSIPPRVYKLLEDEQRVDVASHPYDLVRGVEERDDVGHPQGPTGELGLTHSRVGRQQHQRIRRHSASSRESSKDYLLVTQVIERCDHHFSDGVGQLAVAPLARLGGDVVAVVGHRLQHTLLEGGIGAVAWQQR
mmetsp:Transcript_12749/g.18805  ORF Transcript_12749/g.18805 Transcript_12749/m.18805 type:complete len:290 (-) Transcript_12749:753-1622(-)